ncbi:IS1 family transposase, partial [Escherichia coli]|nr:IS1 family transposase [Escherichia coli]
LKAPIRWRITRWRSRHNPVNLRQHLARLGRKSLSFSTSGWRAGCRRLLPARGRGCTPDG